MKDKIFKALLFSATTLSLGASPPAPAGYTAHEWGTFTSVQAADGIQMKWNPLSVAELPGFVYSLAFPSGKKAGQIGIAPKAAFFAMQRMETPVIYFYSDHPASVNVNVNFPQGIVTEWFPQASKANTYGNADFGNPLASGGSIRWGPVEILPRDDASHFRTDSSGSHFYAARETDANPVRVTSSAGSEVEKFLFYRGVGSFEAPLNVTQKGDNAESITLKNNSEGDLRSLLVYRIHRGRAAWTLVPQLPSGSSRTVQLEFDRNALPLADFRSKAEPAFKQALTAAGLYQREASAMVKTWDDSWFSEQGIRVLYILPGSWTDRILPLALSPAPRQTVRVMVGRAEMVTRAMENDLQIEMDRYTKSDPAQRNLAIRNTQALGLGRFSEAVMRRILESAPANDSFSNSSWELLKAASKAPVEKPLAQN